MNLFRTKIILSLCLIYIVSSATAQNNGFDSFISRISKQYQIDIALAPELIPALDSIRIAGLENTNIEDLLHKLLDEKNISFQIVDGNKLMLRRESPKPVTAGKYEIKGEITGADGEPLAFAAVGLDNSSHGTFTDENGRFSLFVNDTTTHLNVSYLGYKTMKVPSSTFAGGGKNLKMDLDPVSLKQVIIVIPYKQLSFDPATQSMDLRGYQFFSADQLLNNNAEKLINSLTGYTQFSSEQGIRLRGSDANNSLVLMDGLPVHDPYHYYNIFSAFNGHYFSSVKLYKNNMPVEYGGRVDGLINIDSDHQTPGSKLLLDTDLLLSSLSADWDITRHIRLTAGARVSHTSSLNEALSDSTVANFSQPGKFKNDNEYASSLEPTFNFYDINLGLRGDDGNQVFWKASYFKNRDHLETLTSTSVETTEHFNEITSIEQQIQSRDVWKNEGASADLQIPFMSRVTLNLNGFISTFEKNSNYNSTSDEMEHNMHHVSKNAGVQNSLLNSIGLKAFVSKDLSGHQAYKIGLDVQRHTIDLLATENQLKYLSQVQEEFESTFFGEYRLNFLRALELTFGGRLTHLTSTEKIYTQPHLMMNYIIDQHLSLKSAYSKNIQSIQQLTLENRFGREVDFVALSQPEKGYPVLRSDKYMFGGGYKSSHFNTDVEFYYKKLNGIINVRALRPDPSFHNHQAPGEFYQLFEGDGWTTGMDVVLNYKKNNFESTISYTLSKISEQFDGLFNGQSFSPEEDRRHQFKLSGSYQMGRFTINSLLTYKTRAPYLSLVKLDGKDGIGHADQAIVFDYLDPYFSLDLGVDYTFNLFHQPAQIGVALINATNHTNINDVEHIGAFPKDRGMGSLYVTQKTELLGRTFNVHVRYLIQ